MVCPADSHVTILLSTFDGAAWLPELLASLAAQSHDNWSLLVRDDGSSDDSVAVISAAASADARVELWRDDLGNIGPAASFMTLLRQVDTGMFAFCDQDDVWLPHKLEASIDELAECSIAAVYTDAEVTDGHGRILSRSALADRGADGEVPFGHLLVNNAAIGATLLGTAALAKAAVTLADNRPVLMHDWWTALVAGHQGSLRCLTTPTIRWRRHGATVTGTRPGGWRARAQRRIDYLRWSIDAADRLRAAPHSPSSAAGRAVDALAEVDPAHPTIRALIRAWRRGNVRAWPRRGELSLLFSVALGRKNQ